MKDFLRRRRSPGRGGRPRNGWREAGTLRRFLRGRRSASGSYCVSGLAETASIWDKLRFMILIPPCVCTYRNKFFRSIQFLCKKAGIGAKKGDIESLYFTYTEKKHCVYPRNLWNFGYDRLKIFYIYNSDGISLENREIQACKHTFLDIRAQKICIYTNGLQFPVPEGL